MPRRTVRVSSILILFLVTFEACAVQEKEFIVWIGGAPQEVDYLEKLVEEFENKTGMTVGIVRQPTDSDQRRQGLVISLESHQPDPDVFLMDVVWIGQFALSGWLEPLDAHMHTDNFSVGPFFRGIVEQADTYHDSLYALPVYVDGGLLYYRTDLLRQYGFANPPDTWDDLRKEAEQIQEDQRHSRPDFNGFVWQGAQYEGLVCTFLEFASSNNGGILAHDSVNLATPQNVKALRFMYDLIHKYHVSPENTYTEMKEEEVRHAFQRGNALFERNWPYAWKLHQEDNSPVKGKVGIAPLPHFENGKSASTLGGWHIGISRFSDKKEAAWRFVRYVEGYEVQKKLALHLGWNPGRRDVYADPEVLKSLPYLKQLEDVFHHAVARPNVPYYSQISDIMQRYLNKCLAGKESPEVVLRSMQQEIHEVTGLYGSE